MTVLLSILCIGNSGVGKTALIESMLYLLSLPEGNHVRPGTILGDILQYSAAKTSTTTKLTQTSEPPLENMEGTTGMCITDREDDEHFISVIFREIEFL